MGGAFLGFDCARCGAPAPPEPRIGVSPCCAGPLFARYDFAAARSALPAPGGGGARGVWRYAAVLPLPPGARPVTLGEGGTPLLEIARFGRRCGAERLHLKIEAANPTGSFKDRGMTVAISLAVAWGVEAIVLPTAGNAGASAAAYAARAGLDARVHSPKNTPREILAEIRLRGAGLTLHDGSIADAGRAAREDARSSGRHDVATFREPGRVEGKKTMAYELREDLGRLPDAIVYPCGGGTGVVAMARAFREMRELAWSAGEAPRLYAVQSERCAPVVRAFEAGSTEAPAVEAGETIAAGLRVPSPFAHREILAALRATGGGAVAVTEDEIRDAARALATTEGILPCPEGAAALAGTRRLLEAGELRAKETIVVFETASGLKYLDAWTAPR
ncbi:MAG: threonine synthase [Candidatus Eiseniibacteriota bacterium]